MKSILIASIMSILSLPCFAEVCRLQTPIALPKDFLEYGAHFSHVKLDQTPKFTDPSNYDPGKDSLDLNLFPVFLNGSKSSYIGANIFVFGNLEGVGVSNGYSGNLEVGGSTLGNGNEVIYSFRQVSHYDGHWENGRPRHVAGDAITESMLTVSDGMLISMRLQIPVYSIWDQDELSTHVAFTGEHQNLCLQSVP